MFNIVVSVLMFVLIVVFLVKGVGQPGVVMLGVPSIAALIMGFTPKEINTFIGNGLNSVSGTIFLMVTAILYFGILHKAGVFKVLINFIMKFMKNSVGSTILIAQLLSMATQLDGSGATTALCTIPPMRPLFEKQHIRKECLMFCITIGSGILLILPWMPGFVEACAYCEVDVQEAFRVYTPTMIFGIILFLAMNPLLAFIEKKHGAGMSDEEFAAVKAEVNQPVEFPLGKGIAIFDGVFTIALLALIMAGYLKTNIGFGLGTAIMLTVNFPKVKDQREYIKENANAALNMAFTMLGVATLVGVSNGTGAMAQLAEIISANIPAGALHYVPLVVAIFGLPLGILLANAFGSVIVPAIIAMCAGLGGNFTALYICGALWSCKLASANLNPFNASPYLGLSLAGVEMSDHLKYSFFPSLVYGLCCTVFMVITGVLPV